jgi:hypothetical protein
MSYDLDAFPLPPGVSAEDFIESGAREELSADDSPPTEAQRAAMERAAEALLAVDPSAERAEISGRMDEIAAEPKRPWWKIWG